MSIGIPKGFLDPPPVQAALRVPAGAREHAIALFAAGGFSTPEIAARLGVGPRVVVQALGRPDVQALVANYRQELLSGAGNAVEEIIKADGPRNVERLQQLRDQNKDVKVALGAARELLARQAPARTEHREDRTTRIVIGRDDMIAMREAVREVEGVVVKEVVDAAGEPSGGNRSVVGGASGGGAAAGGDQPQGVPVPVPSPPARRGRPRRDQRGVRDSAQAGSRDAVKG